MSIYSYTLVLYLLNSHIGYNLDEDEDEDGFSKKTTFVKRENGYLVDAHTECGTIGFLNAEGVEKQFTYLWDYGDTHEWDDIICEQVDHNYEGIIFSHSDGKVYIADWEYVMPPPFTSESNLQTPITIEIEGSYFGKLDISKLDLQTKIASLQDCPWKRYWEQMDLTNFDIKMKWLLSLKRPFHTEIDPIRMYVGGEEVLFDKVDYKDLED